MEIIVVILLGITALLTAWASWVGSLHAGNQATNYTQSNNISADGNSRWNEASQLLAQDTGIWDEISGLRIDYAFAEEKNDTTEMERIEWKLDKIYADNVTEQLQKAIDWADEKEEYTSPFAMEGFIDTYFADAQEVLAEAETILAQGQEDNANGDTFGLVVVTIFMATIPLPTGFNITSFFIK